MDQWESTHYIQNPQVPERLHKNNPFNVCVHKDKPKKRTHEKVLIIYTGGTIGMPSTDENGSEIDSIKPKKGYLQELMAKMNDLDHPTVPDYDIDEWDELLDSSDFSPAEWITLAKQVKENYHNYDGFVILTGTDTMAYTASALSFMFENLNKSVIITGSMIPLDVPVSDARRNLTLSLIMAVKLEVTEVMLYFGNKLLRGNRARKTSSADIHAFDSPNMEPLARMGVKISLSSKILTPPRRRFLVHLNLYTKLTAMVMIPGFDDGPLRSFFESSTKENPVGVVLLLYGSGNAPVRKKEFVEAIKYAIQEKHAVIVITTQCLKGAVSLSTYETGNELRKAGVFDAKDMTPEACVTKLAVLMGRGFRGKLLQEAMEKNLRGEITTREGIAYTPANSSQSFSAL